MLIFLAYILWCVKVEILFLVEVNSIFNSFVETCASKLKEGTKNCAIQEKATNRRGSHNKTMPKRGRKPSKKTVVDEPSNKEKRVERENRSDKEDEEEFEPENDQGHVDEDFQPEDTDCVECGNIKKIILVCTNITHCTSCDTCSNQ
jgi:hypothetical protein